MNLPHNKKELSETLMQAASHSVEAQLPNSF